MSRKRRNTSSPESEASSSPTPKRARPSWMDEDFDPDFEHPTRKEQPHVNATYGQTAAFPGLDDGGEELFYGPASDGIEYLRMVRSEAKGVPHLLVAPNATTPSIQPNNFFHSTEEGSENGGYYEDGAYVAAPTSSAAVTSSDEKVPDPQECYYASLCTRFSLVRATLRCTPPLAAIQALDQSHPVSFPPESNKAIQQWRLNVRNTEPTMVQLACLDTESTLAVVRVLTGLLAATVRTRSRDKIGRFGAWAWGILGRCKERGELGSEEVADIRELGKSAVGLLVGIRNRSERAYGEEDLDLGNGGSHIRKSKATSEEQSMGDNEEENSSLSEHGPRHQQKHQYEDDKAEATNPLANESEGKSSQTEMNVDNQIRTMLDAIITIVGQFYGQMDLLEFRDIWDEEDHEADWHAMAQ